MGILDSISIDRTNYRTFLRVDVSIYFSTIANAKLKRHGTVRKSLQCMYTVYTCRYTLSCNMLTKKIGNTFICSYFMFDFESFSIYSFKFEFVDYVFSWILICWIISISKIKFIGFFVFEKSKLKLNFWFEKKEHCFVFYVINKEKLEGKKTNSALIGKFCRH